jgi:uncharacterized protein YyaL (SSP411 family)
MVVGYLPDRASWDELRTHSRSILRLAASRRLDLTKQMVHERRGWPVTLNEFHIATDHAEIERAIQNVLGWITRGQHFWNCGGIPASYSARTRTYEGPYPETTGYSIPTLLSLSRRSSAPEAAVIAEKAAYWLVSRQLNDGSIRCNIEAPDQPTSSTAQIVIFDCGAILQGLVAISMHLSDQFFTNAALRLARFLIHEQNADGIWDQHLHFAKFGSHNALVGYALINAGVAFNEPDFIAAGDRCLIALRSRIRTNGYIEGCEFPGVKSGVAFLHPHIYTIEGFLKTQSVYRYGDYLSAVMPSIDALWTDMERTGCVPGAFIAEDMTTAYPFTALTAIAQLADIGFRAAELSGNQRYISLSRKLMSFLRSCLADTLPDEGWRGGVPSAFPIDGEYCPFTVNNWGAKYFIDASLGELRAPPYGHTTNA